jgi:UPF0148 protein
MAAVSKKQLAAASEMLRKGATLLSEPCPSCGGVQLKYRDEVICIVCGAGKERAAQQAAKPSSLKEILEAKALEVAYMLRDECSVERQRELLDLLSKYLELLSKLG